MCAIKIDLSFDSHSDLQDLQDLGAALDEIEDLENETAKKEEE